MSERKRLHPIAAVLNFFRIIKSIWIPFFLFLFIGMKDVEGPSIYVVGAGHIAMVLIIMGTGILSWYRFSYWIEEEELRIEYGIFVKKKRYIPFERIQSLDLSESIWHRPFQLVKVKVETAGSSGGKDAEGVLTAISREEALDIQQLVTVANKSRSNQSKDPLPSKEDIVYKITMKELMLLASTSGGVGVVISGVFAFISQFDEFIPYKRLFKGLEHFIANGFLIISIMVFIGFVLAWGMAFIITVVKYADFTVKRVNNDFIITRGLLEKKHFTISLKRIHAVRVSENIIRQPLGYASVYLESAGGSANNVESAKVVFLPFIQKNRMEQLLTPYLPDYIIKDNCKRIPNRACIRYLIRGWLSCIPFIVIPIIVFKAWGFLSFSLLILSSVWSFLNFKDAGWEINKDQLTLRYRKVVKHTVFMKKKKIQSITMAKSYFQRRRDLATVEAIVKSGLGGAGGMVADLDVDDSVEIYQWYSRDKGARAGTMSQGR